MFSLLPISYPGHNIVTEDLGVIIDEDNCNVEEMVSILKF